MIYQAAEKLWGFNTGGSLCFTSLYAQRTRKTRTAQRNHFHSLKDDSPSHGPVGRVIKW